ncbi:hypothetical protein H5410_043353 [Solanum commersonii]|uniref:Uncharacterized protein n=1 Tax=Solanum commersonii TaxID=4109 RepID=A0A9J5XYY4_SOLCO|nr:hypothetical protein H5410_043353 [Solanum commersonii]
MPFGFPVQAHRRNIPIVIDTESKRERVDDLLNLATYIVWIEAPSIPAALVSVLLKLPNIKFVIVTLGEDGYMMLERAEAGMLAYFLGSSDDIAKGIGTVSGKLLLGTAEKIPPSELVMHLLEQFYMGIYFSVSNIYRSVENKESKALIELREESLTCGLEIRKVECVSKTGKRKVAEAKDTC